jgi:hypothetical protein
MKHISIKYAREELQRRWEIGHQFGCQCGMKPSCCDLRKVVPFKFLHESEWGNEALAIDTTARVRNHKSQPTP